MTQDEGRRREDEDDRFAETAAGEVAESGLRGCLNSATVLALLLTPLSLFLG